MLNKVYYNIADDRKPGSLAYKLRLKRISLLKEKMMNKNGTIKILDIGGTELFWKRLGCCEDSKLDITVLNLSKEEDAECSNIVSVIGDARNMSEFEDNEFDIAFSNSVIEHVGDYEDQELMAKEVQRVGKHFFIQTPNLYFPVEPHVFFPFFQFFPMKLKLFIINNFKLGFSKSTNKNYAKEVIESLRLLKKSELKELFPEATIYEEKICRMTYSFILYNNQVSNEI